MAVTHTKVSVIGDGADSSLVQPSDWNSDHVIESILPDTDSARDLGSNAYRWQDAYVEGVNFPATQVPSAGVNTLDDYEEADYTPTANGITFAAATGRYTKIGRLVTVQFDVTWPSTSNTDAARISLPFTCGSLGATAVANSPTSFISDEFWYVTASTAYMSLSTSLGVRQNVHVSSRRYLGSVTYSV